MKITGRIAIQMTVVCPRLSGKVKDISFCKDCRYYSGITNDKDFDYVVICDYVKKGNIRR